HQVVVDEEQDSTLGNADARIACRRRSTVRLPHHVQPERESLSGEPLGGPVGRAVIDQHYLEFTCIDGLPLKPVEYAREASAPVVRGNYNAQFRCHDSLNREPTQLAAGRRHPRVPRPLKAARGASAAAGRSPKNRKTSLRPMTTRYRGPGVV